MTVCIAAMCEENTQNPKIIFCTDRKLSSALGSSETGLKIRAIKQKWKGLTAGTEVDIHACMHSLVGRFHNEGNVNETNAVQLVRAALNDRKLAKCNEWTQGKYGISYDTLLQSGKNLLPEEHFRLAISEIELIKIDAEFIIAGFPNQYPILVKTDGRCGASVREDYAIIGEGAYLAQASLLNRAQYNIESFGRTIYAVYEAKRFAEGAPTVGHQTLITVLHSNGDHEIIQSAGLDFLKNRYEKLGPQPIPEINIEPSFLKKLN